MANSGDRAVGSAGRADACATRRGTVGSQRGRAVFSGNRRAIGSAYRRTATAARVNVAVGAHRHMPVSPPAIVLPPGPVTEPPRPPPTVTAPVWTAVSKAPCSAKGTSITARDKCSTARRIVHIAIAPAGEISGIAQWSPAKGAMHGVVAAEVRKVFARPREGRTAAAKFSRSKLPPPRDERSKLPPPLNPPKDPRSNPPPMLPPPKEPRSKPPPPPPNDPRSKPPPPKPTTAAMKASATEAAPAKAASPGNRRRADDRCQQQQTHVERNLHRRGPQGCLPIWGGVMFCYGR